MCISEEDDRRLWGKKGTNEDEKKEWLKKRKKIGSTRGAKEYDAKARPEDKREKEKQRERDQEKGTKQLGHTEALSVAFPRVRSSLRWAEDEKIQESRQNYVRRGRERKRRLVCQCGRGGRKANYIKTHGVRNTGPRRYGFILSGVEGRRKKSKEKRGRKKRWRQLLKSHILDVNILVQLENVPKVPQSDYRSHNDGMMGRMPNIALGISLSVV